MRWFDRAARFYGRLTRNPLWRESVREMARHFPPSGAALRLLDVGCGPGNSALELLQLRSDLHIIGLDRSIGMLRQARQTPIRVILGDACHLPLPDSSMDAITAHSVFYLLTDQPTFLAEAQRVLRPGGRLIMLDPASVPYPLKVIWYAPRSAPGVLLWHIAARRVNHGNPITPESMARTLENAGFARVFGERAVKGYGVLSRGEKPYSESLPLPQLQAVRGRHLFLLIQQTPNKPVWALQSNEIITWGAATARQGDQPVVLAFTSLPKAVAFMQPAVTTGALLGINKVAKFDKAIAARWEFPILLDPSFEAIRDALPGPLIGIDPHTAITGEE